MAENRRGKDNRFYFSRGQMVLLGAVFTVASLIIFVLGVFVGQVIEGRKLMKKDEPLVKIPIKPGAQEGGTSAGPAKNEITFNDSAPKSAGPAPTDEGAKAAKPAEKVVAKAESQDAPNSSGRGSTKASEKKPEKSASEAPKAGASVKTESKDQNGWRAQVNAFPDERSAKLVVDRLKDKGYNAYVTEVENRGKTWYRVNVGKYGSRDEADKMVELLRTKENFPKAFAATR